MTDGVKRVDVAAIRARYTAAREMVRRLCLPRGNIEHRDWLMSVPADETRDPDLVIHRALRDIPALLDALAAAQAEIARLQALAHRLADQEHGARCEQIEALARLGIIVTLDAHLARADAHTTTMHQHIDALGEAAPATREE